MNHINACILCYAHNWLTCDPYSRMQYLTFIPLDSFALHIISLGWSDKANSSIVIVYIGHFNSIILYCFILLHTSEPLPAALKHH